MRKIGAVLMNLGGPTHLDEVYPFLFSLFQDPLILRIPQPFRWTLARVIARSRLKEARHIYQSLGGRSPLLENTQAQATALEKALNQDTSDVCYHVRVAMRHATPLTEEVVRDMAQMGCDQVVLVPLYPQYSSTTTLSSIQAWQKAVAAHPNFPPTQILCCYPQMPGLVHFYADAIAHAIQGWDAKARSQARIMCSAHGLPVKIVKQGDPYPDHVQQTVQALRKVLKEKNLGIKDDQVIITYQSRVGPLQWLTPSTVDEIGKAGKEKRPVVLVPISFVSEHSETLFELDQQYQELAQNAGVPLWARIPTPGDHPDFIQGLVQLVRQTLKAESRYYAPKVCTPGPASAFCARCKVA